jgi:hypothetical protein
MSTLEREVLEKFHQLDKTAQARVREQIAQDELGTESFDFLAWSREVEAIRREIQASHGGVWKGIKAVDMLQEIRDGEDE